MTTTCVDVEILGQVFQIKCPEHEVESLKQAAKLLEEKFNRMRDSGAIISNDKMAVITSLNFAHQVLLLEQKSQQMIQEVNQRVHELQVKVETALAKNAQREFVSAE